MRTGGRHEDTTDDQDESHGLFQAERLLEKDYGENDDEWTVEAVQDRIAPGTQQIERFQE